MTPLVFLLLSVAGGVGAALRFFVDGVVKGRTVATYPVGTTIINVSGSLLLGFITGLATAQVLPVELQLVLGTGLMGGYTTFSTASFETVRLVQEGRVRAGLANGLGMLVLSVLAATAGLLAGQSL